MAPPPTALLKEKLAQLFGGGPAESIDATIIANLQAYTDPDEMREFLEGFVWDNTLHKDVDDIVTLFFGPRATLTTAIPAASPTRVSAMTKQEDVTTAPPTCQTATRSKRGRRTQKPLDSANRQFCFCQAQLGTHGLLGNCLTCGKIVCTAEGEGPCLFCGNAIAPVGAFVPDPYARIPRHTSSSSEKSTSSSSSSSSPERCGGQNPPVHHRQHMTEAKRALQDTTISCLKEAIAHKNRLLGFERTHATRTQVFDDTTDWFSEAGNQWLSAVDRATARLKAQQLEERHQLSKHQRYLNVDVGPDGGVHVTTHGVTHDHDPDETIDTFLTQARERQLLSGVAHMPTPNVRQLLFGATEILRYGDRFLTSARQDTATTPSMTTPALTGDCEAVYKAFWNRLISTNCPKRTMMHTRDHQGNGGSESLFNDSRKMTKWEHDMMTEPAETPEEPSTLSPQTLSSETKRKTAATSLLEPEDVSPWTNHDDQGVCLTLHQPWASLLVYGFKRVEGRSWNTEYRGRLWIHAASKEPNAEDIEALQLMYAEFYDTLERLETDDATAHLTSATVRCRPPFPTSYPTSCLLGCVDLEDCLSQAEYLLYRDTLPLGSLGSETNESSFVFLCKRPRRLLLPIHMKGGHKLWKLPAERLPYIQRSLRCVQWPLKVICCAEPQSATGSASTTKDPHENNTDVPAELCPSPDDRSTFQAALLTLDCLLTEGVAALGNPKVLHPSHAWSHLMCVFSPLLQQSLRLFVLTRQNTPQSWRRVNVRKDAVWVSRIEPPDERLEQLNRIVIEIARRPPGRRTRTQPARSSRDSDALSVSLVSVPHCTRSTNSAAAAETKTIPLLSADILKTNGSLQHYTIICLNTPVTVNVASPKANSPSLSLVLSPGDCLVSHLDVSNPSCDTSVAQQAKYRPLLIVFEYSLPT